MCSQEKRLLACPLVKFFYSSGMLFSILSDIPCPICFKIFFDGFVNMLSSTSILPIFFLLSPQVLLTSGSYFCFKFLVPLNLDMCNLLVNRMCDWVWWNLISYMFAKVTSTFVLTLDDKQSMPQKVVSIAFLS